jgi:glycosyltransferase involved in cell wall biosynthesis
MACGTLAIVSPAANVDRLVTHGAEGLVCEGTHADAIASTLESFFALDASARRRMGAAGRAHAERRFGVRRMIDRTSSIYERVLSSNPRWTISQAARGGRVQHETRVGVEA